MRLTILFLMLCIFNLNAQNENEKYKPGIYKSIYSFKIDNPTFPLVGEMTEGESPSLGMFKGKSKIAHYSFEFSSDAEKTKYKSQIGEIFGFSDGINLYLPSNYCKDCDFNEQVYFKVNYIGQKYAYFDYYFPRSDMRGYDGGEDTMVVLLKDGEKFPLTKKFIKKQLNSYPKLLDEFKNEKRKADVLTQYLLVLDKTIE